MTQVQPESQETAQAFANAAAAYDAAAQSGDMYRILAPDGTVVRPDALPSSEQRLHLYRQMRRARHFDERGWVLYRQGRLGVFPPFGGMEASQCGTAAALTKNDWLFPTYRDTGAALTLGLPIARTLAYWRTSPHGWQMPADLKVLPFYIPIAPSTRRRWARHWRKSARARATSLWPLSEMAAAARATFTRR